MDSMEKFFQDGAQNHNLEFVESDWLQLKGQLDKEMPVRFSILYFLRKFGLGVLLLVSIPLLWLAFKPYPVNEGQNTNITLSDSDNKVAEVRMDEEVPHSEAMKTEHNEIIEINRTVSDDETGVDNYSNAAEDQMVIKESSQVGRQENTGVESNNLGQVVFEEGAETDRHIGSGQLLFLSCIPPHYTLGPGDHEVNGIEETLEVIPNTKNKTYFKLGVGYSPDFSTVGIGNFVSPGSRWTATVEFGFFNRFVINTGVVFVSNKYEAYGEDYHAPSRYWKKGIVAEEAYGECQMIDIPLNLRYNVIQKGKNVVFINAGASTYFVTKEDYYFHYEQEDPELPTHWGTDKTTIYPFGIINLSFGYEHEFTQRSGVQIEPFIKIPTTGIGWGNVDLHTLGIYFLYKYKL